MSIIEIKSPSEAAHLFDGISDTMVLSYLGGHMGRAYTDGYPVRSCEIINGDFCIMAGVPSRELLQNITGNLIIWPVNPEIDAAVRKTYGDRAKPATRYSLPRENSVFCRERLYGYASSLPAEYNIRLFDRDLYSKALSAEWSRDFVSQFSSADDYLNRGLGAAVICGGELAAGASSYVVFDGGIEIELDTKEPFRHRGLATAAAARLILECLDRSLYPGWDAANLASLHIAEKLGYHPGAQYTVYRITQ